MQTSESRRVIAPHTALNSRARAAPAGFRAARPAVSLLCGPGRCLLWGRSGEGGDAQSGGAQRGGDEPARCGHARRLGERPLVGDPGPIGPASTGPGQTPPLGCAALRGSLSGGSTRVDAKILRASSLTLFPTIKKKKKKGPTLLFLWPVVFPFPDGLPATLLPH